MFDLVSNDILKKLKSRNNTKATGCYLNRCTLYMYQWNFFFRFAKRPEVTLVFVRDDQTKKRHDLSFELNFVEINHFVG